MWVFLLGVCVGILGDRLSECNYSALYLGYVNSFMMHVWGIFYDVCMEFV